MHLNVIFSLTIQNNDNKNLTNHFTIEGSNSEKLFGVTVDSSFLCDNHITDLSLHEKCQVFKSATVDVKNLHYLLAKILFPIPRHYLLTKIS